MISDIILQFAFDLEPFKKGVRDAVARKDVGNELQEVLQWMKNSSINFD
ncbi:hypothetical protein [Desulfonatronum lacustre]|nr:hypothetical protein [Desulfonatronum lacustre]